MINNSNYEAFALDYLEGNLSKDIREAFEAFLSNNPAIKEEVLTLSQMVTLVPDESIVFENKDALMRKDEGAKVIVMNTRFWYRATAVAAAIGLLVIGYMAGYKTAETEGVNQVIVEKQTPPVNSEEKQEEILVNQVREEAPIEIEKTVIKDKKSPDTIKEPQESTYESVANTNSIQELQIKPNPVETPKEVIQNETPFVKQTIITIAALPNKRIQAVESFIRNSMEDQVIAIVEAQQIGYSNREMLADTPKPKQRRFRDLLGRLPFEGVSSDNFIPTYFKETGD